MFQATNQRDGIWHQYCDIEKFRQLLDKLRIIFICEIDFNQTNKQIGVLVVQNG